MENDGLYVRCKNPEKEGRVLVRASNWYVAYMPLEGCAACPLYVKPNHSTFQRNGRCRYTGKPLQPRVGSGFHIMKSEPVPPFTAEQEKAYYERREAELKLRRKQRGETGADLISQEGAIETLEMLKAIEAKRNSGQQIFLSE